MAYSLEFGQIGWTILYGIKTSNNIPFYWVVNDFNHGRTPAECETCKQDGMFEGIFYGLCAQCCIKSGYCKCVYCSVAKKDGHKRIECRTNFCKLIKDLQMVVDDLKHNYPNDEYGIVKEGIDAGIYILNIHTKFQYEKMENETRMPEEVCTLSNGELTFRWNPSMEIPESVINAAIKASKRLGTYEWVQEFWGEEIMKKEADTTDMPPLVYEYMSNGEKSYIDCSLTLTPVRMEAFNCDHCGKELVERDDEGNLKVCDCGEDIGAYLAIDFKPKKSTAT